MASAANGNEDNCPEDQGGLTSWNHIPRLHTCQHCDRIVITRQELKHCLVSLPHTNLEAFQAEVDGCPVFCMLNKSLRSLAHRSRGSPLDLFRFLFNSKYPERGYAPLHSSASFSRIAAQKKARSNNIAKLLWRTHFILGNLCRRRINLFVSPERLYLLHGTTAIQCDGEFKILKGMYKIKL